MRETTHQHGIDSYETTFPIDSDGRDIITKIRCRAQINSNATIAIRGFKDLKVPVVSGLKAFWFLTHSLPLVEFSTGDFGDFSGRAQNK